MADQGEIVSPQAVEEEGALIRRIAPIALLSVAVGFAIQGLILAAKLWGGVDNATAGFAASLAQGVTWSVLVCVGVGIVTSVSEARPLLAGLLALLVAPLALALAKASQKVVAGLISAAEQEAALSLGMASSLKAVEYGILGWMLAKFALVVLLSGYHHALARWRKDFAADRNIHPERFYRIANEVPTVLMIGIVILVIVKPF